MFEWLVNLPVWVQAPLVVLVVLAICAVVAWGIHALMWKIIPPTAQEKSLLPGEQVASGEADGAGGEAGGETGGETGGAEFNAGPGTAGSGAGKRDVTQYDVTHDGAVGPTEENSRS